MHQKQRRHALPFDFADDFLDDVFDGDDAEMFAFGIDNNADRHAAGAQDRQDHKGHKVQRVRQVPLALLARKGHRGHRDCQGHRV